MSSSKLTLILLVQVYIFGTDCKDVRDTWITDQSPIIYQESTEYEDSHVDYTYIPNIGAYKVHTKAANWHVARLICEEEDGHLAIINSFAESAALKRLFLASRPYQTGSFHSHYAIIGFRERLFGGGYVTVSGEPLEDTGFYKWAATEPNNLHGNEHCGSMDDSGLLNDINCGNKYSFICELPKHIGINHLLILENVNN